MRRLLCSALALIAMLPSPGTAGAQAGSRVIVSNTVNDTLLFFDAATLRQSQAPLVSKGAGPVRLAVRRIGARTFVFSANHGAAGTLGIFDATGDSVIELARSPFPTGGFGAVGVATGTAGHNHPYVAVTNTYQALAGCGVPSGSVTVFDAKSLEASDEVIPGTTTEVAGAQPFAVETDGAEGIFVSANCTDRVDVFKVEPHPLVAQTLTASRQPAWGTTGRGPDGMAWDEGDLYVTNIGSGTLSVFDAWSSGSNAPGTTVPVGAGPIEVVRARSTSGKTWLITANGRGDSISVVSRDAVRACLRAEAAVCPAVLTTIPTGVAGGAPESVAYDAAGDRVFVVNKTFPPSLSVIQLEEDGDAVGGRPIATIPLGAVGDAANVPALIAFDVVVQER